MNETLIKYLAGLIDADGTIQFVYRPVKNGYTLHLRMSLDAASSVDHKGFIPSLPELTGLGKVYRREGRGPNRSEMYTWSVGIKSDLEKIIPRLVKHMVVKATHFDWCLTTLRSNSGKILTEKEVQFLKKEIVTSRQTSSWKTSKKHPTWAWTAGFLDGDGFFSLRYNKKTGATTTRMGAVCHKNDRRSLDLLHKAFGGSLYEEKDCIRWHRNLGPADAKFSLPFLAKIVQHSKLKGYKIEQIIHNIRQRLSKNKPKG